MTSRREVFTVWMKSLVMNSNGCTIFDSKGEIVYRVDNYDCKCSDEVYLMDLRGNVLFTILRKKLSVFGHWEGYKCYGSKKEKKKPWFKVSKPWMVLKGYSPYEAYIWWDKDQSNCYTLEGFANKSACKIIDKAGGLVAEVKQKQSTSGVALGNDVLTLAVEPNIDHSLIMGLVVVYGLINHSI